MVEINAAFIVKFEGTFTAGRVQILFCDARACNVFWIAEGYNFYWCFRIPKELLLHPGAITLPPTRSKVRMLTTEVQ
jgi:hypothetical protein